ncbi:ABC transporter G family member 23-like [Tetranychus urticae]|uniref:ABC transporter domain-containing protein n=1 Tax=Tetranychus urticae TaxID=32264 RepID=T1K2V0_TETUR|nr:ABC transporter G family member 23-like [Tetranychus urticae]
MSSELAICGKSVSLNLGSYLSPTLILNNLNLAIPKGCIYGLIGPSGCGKTTLQKCIMGVYKPDHGSISVFGSTPGSPESLVPGPSVGYMPQDIALDSELTVREQLVFLGRINNLNMELINIRIKEITETLEISDIDNRSGQFSGGQQRRISLACTFIHQPSLYLLDEPTVGSDIVLVHKIWNYLKHLRDNSGATIIISTHYIEEVNSADLFGFMSKGTMIIQDSPSNFIQTSGTRTLEAAILKEYIKIYSHRLETQRPSFFPEQFLNDTDLVPKRRRSLRSSIDSLIKRVSFAWFPRMKKSKEKTRSQESRDVPPSLPSYLIISLLIWRYLLRWKITMTIPFAVFLTMTITSSIVMFGVYGLPMKQLAVGIVKHANSSNYLTNVTNYMATDDFSFLQMPDEVIARQSVENGTITGYLVIPEDWDYYLKQKVVTTFSTNPNEASIKLSQVTLIQDTTHAGKVLTVQTRLFQALESLMNNITVQSGFHPMYNSFFDSRPIFKSLDEPDKLAPRYNFIVRLYVFFIETFTILLLTAWFLREGSETVNERLISLGLKRYQLLASLMVVATSFLTISFMAMFASFVIFLKLPAPSSWFAVVWLTVSIVICGICKARLLGSNIKSDIGCMTLIIFYNALLWLLGCVAWPYEGLDYFMQPLTVMVPHLEPSTALIRLTIYGDSVYTPQVYHGIGVATVWAVIHLLITFVLARKW